MKRLLSTLSKEAKKAQPTLKEERHHLQQKGSQVHKEKLLEQKYYR
jgi:hypothetical protein